MFHTKEPYVTWTRVNFTIPGTRWVEVNFVMEPIGPQEGKRHLATHCPIMVRLHFEGVSYAEEECRCDAIHIKNENHPNRCHSAKECPIRDRLISSYEARHEILDTS